LKRRTSREHFGDEWKGRPVRYVLQESLTGTAGALYAAKDVLPERFIVMMGDDLYHPSDIAALLRHDFAMVAMPVEEREMGGEILRDNAKRFSRMRKEHHYVARGLANTGLYALDRRIFDYDPVPIGGSSSEFGLPHTLALLAHDIPVAILTATKWMQITAPEDLDRAKDFYE
jgi:bifunctional UDP-N-acetylglucosamine pyrophosphorylase/glucosamine-1-phosphate N-acetyltransferase